MDKKDLRNSIVDNTQFWNESVDFQPNLVDQHILPLTVCIDFKSENLSKHYLYFTNSSSSFFSSCFR